MFYDANKKKTMVETLLKAQNTIDFLCFGVVPEGMHITNTRLSKL